MPVLARRILPLALLGALVLTALLVLRELRGGTGYAAKVLCSGVFVAGRTPESLLAEDLGWFSWLHSRVDRAERTASSDWHGLGRSTAVYRDGLGCALAVGASPDELRAQGFDPGPAPPGRAGIPWPVGDRVAPAAEDGARRAALEAAVASAFGETDPQRRRRTRAVIVLHSGHPVAERYAPGFDATTPLLGWSMTKSVIATLIGVQVLRGRLDPAAGAPVASWRGDERAAITLEQLLRMTSGLAFSERNGALGDSVAMLFRSRSASGYAAHSPLAHAPGTFWSYSSGTSNLLSGILRASLPGAAAYHRFPREALFDRIGMRSAVLETDAAGDFVGSSFCYATARDWARFGLLHAQDGVWEGERLLPAGWVAFVRRPTPQSPRGSYGAHWWLNAGEPGAPETRPFPSLPPDLFFASGYEGQFVVVIPSHDLVVVRLGQSEPERTFDLEEFLREIIAAFPTE